jgi:hypothetical protein
MSGQEDDVNTKVALGVILLSFALAGCGTQKGTHLGGQRTAHISDVSKEELAHKLDDFQDNVTQIIRSTAQVLRELDPSLGNRRSDMMRNVRLTQAFHILVGKKDPMVELLEMWALTVRLQDYFTSGDGRELFGTHQGVAIQAAERMRTQVENIAESVFAEKGFTETRDEIIRFAELHPIDQSYSNLMVYVTQTHEGEPSPFEEVLNIPMAPFKAIQGVDRTATAIHGVQESIKRSASVVEDLPESTRWQLLLLLEDMEKAEVVKSVLADTHTFSQSSARIAERVDTLPAELREQASLLIADIDERQANLQQTLEKVELTAAALDRGLNTAHKAFETLGHTAGDVTATAAEWQLAMTATDELVTSIRQWSDSKPPPHPDKPVVTVKDYQATIQDVSQVVAKLQILLDSSTGQGRKLVNHITWRLILLAGAIALMIMSCRSMTQYWLKKKGVH